MVINNGITVQGAARQDRQDTGSPDKDREHGTWFMVHAAMQTCLV